MTTLKIARSTTAQLHNPATTWECEALGPGPSQGVLRGKKRKRFTTTPQAGLTYNLLPPFLSGRRTMLRRLAIVLILIPAAGCVGQTKSNVDLARMEQIVQSYVPQQFMGSVLVAEDGKILLDKGYGFANLEWQVPNTPTTKFRLGSITKQFTAASILLLEERG